ncbi:MAG: ATP-binding cassette domain-containing protein, partial [Rhodospirillaceae bacterium]|nr:ATP-binding cassette domain-containing protein [Rhodospirillaceae bacterium]
IRNRSPEDRRRVQYIFQNPDASLNPRATVQATLMRPLQQFFLPSRGGFRERVERALHEVRLPASYLARYPVELSGGERQRVAIARGLIAEPELLLCDEVLSALDVSVQASVLRLLRRLKRESAIAMLFISHDLAVVRSLADRVGVLFNGQLLELGGVEEIFGPPYHPYTRELLMAQPGSGLAAAEPADTTPAVAEDAGDAPGCAFAGRCRWQRGALCEDERPPWQDAGRGLRIRCHIPADELRALTSGGAPGPANELSSAPADATCGATPTPR